MNTLRRTVLTGTLAAAFSACGGGGSDADGQAPALATPGPTAQEAGEIVVQLASGADVVALAQAHRLLVLDQFGKRPIWRLRVAAGASVDAVLAQLATDARVRFAEPNIDSETPEGRARGAWAVGGDSGTAGTQWSYGALRITTAHTASIGTGVRVAVLDTGIDRSHPAFTGRIGAARDFVDDDADPSEAGVPADAGHGHGTHVAGIVARVAPGAQIMPVRVLDALGRGNVWVLAEAMAWAVDPDANPASDDGAHVINLSLGPARKTNLVKAATAIANCDFDDDDDDEVDFNDPGFDDDRARCANKYAAVVVAAGGNDGSETQQQFPAAEASSGKLPGLLGVAAHAENLELATFSNRGPWLNIGAPGDKVVSSFPAGGYVTWSGTSMAAPMAAGTAALVLGTYADSRSVLPLDVTARMLARSAALCGTSLRKLDAAAAVDDTEAPATNCP